MDIITLAKQTSFDSNKQNALNVEENVKDKQNSDDDTQDEDESSTSISSSPNIVRGIQDHGFPVYSCRDKSIHSVTSMTSLTSSSIFHFSNPWSSSNAASTTNKMFFDSDPVTFTTSDSFLSLPKWDAVKNGSLFLKFRTNEPNGVLVYSHGIKNTIPTTSPEGESENHHNNHHNHHYHHPSHDYFGIELLEGHVFLLMNLGSGSIKVKATMKRIDDSHWHSIRVTREGRSGRISVDDYSVGFISPNILSDFSSSSSTSSHLHDLDLEGSLFIGSVGTTGFLSSPANMMSPPPELWSASLGFGFVGCVKDLILNNDLLVDLTAYAVDQDSGGVKLGCHSSASSSVSFNKNHLCVQTSCLNEGTCSEGWNRKICHCETTGFTGPRCGREALQVSFNGEQYLKIVLPRLSITQSEDLYLRFRSVRSSGLLLVATIVAQSSSMRPSSASYRNYLILSLESSRLKITLNLGEGNKMSHVGYNLNDDLWHSVKIERRGPSLEIKLDGVNSVTEITGQLITLTIDTFFFGSFGGKKIEDLFPSSSFRSSSSGSTTPASLYHSLKDVPNFSGFIQSVIFNGVDMIESSRSGQMEGLFNSTAEVDFSTEKERLEFNLDSPVTFKSRDTFVALSQLPAFSEMSIWFSFKTLSLSGLLLFNGGKRNHFISLELENGHLVYSFNLGDGGGRRLTSKTRYLLNDNTWHSVSIQRSVYNHHSLRIDDQVFTISSSGINTHLHLDGLLYLGGVPKEMYEHLPKLIRATYGFEGCLAGLDINHDSIDPSSPTYALIPSTLVSPGCSSFASLEEKRCTLTSCTKKGVCVNLSASGGHSTPSSVTSSPTMTTSSSFACDCDQSSFISTSCSEEGASFRFGPLHGLTSSSSSQVSPYHLPPLLPMSPSGGIITVTFPDGNHMDTKSDSLSLGIVTTVDNAVILRIDSSSTNDFMEMQILDGNVLMVYNLGAEDHEVIDLSVNISDGRYHSIKFDRNGPNATLQIDNHNPVHKIPTGKQLTIFNSLAKIQVGGKTILPIDNKPSSSSDSVVDPLPSLSSMVPKKDLPNSHSIFQGIISGLTYNGMKVLDLAAENSDERLSIEGDVQLLTILPKQFNPKNVHSLLNGTDRHINRKHLAMNEKNSHNRLWDTDELILSKGGPQYCWDDDDCVNMVTVSATTSTSSYDDLITPFLSHGEKLFAGLIPPPKTKVVSCDENNDDEDCSETGSGDGKKEEEDDDDDEDEKEEDTRMVLRPSVEESESIWDPTSTHSPQIITKSYEVAPWMTTSTDSPRIVFKATISTTTEYINPKELEQTYRPKLPYPRPTLSRPSIVDVPRPEGSNKPVSGSRLPAKQTPSSNPKNSHVSKTSAVSSDQSSLVILVIVGIILTIVVAAPLSFFVLRFINPSGTIAGNILFNPMSGMRGHPAVPTNDIYASVNKNTSYTEAPYQGQPQPNHILINNGRQLQQLHHQSVNGSSVASGLSNGQLGTHSPAIPNPYNNSQSSNPNNHIVLPVNHHSLHQQSPQQPHSLVMSPGGASYHHPVTNHQHQISTMMPHTVNSGPQSILKKRRDSNEWYV